MHASSTGTEGAGNGAKARGPAMRQQLGSWQAAFASITPLLRMAWHPYPYAPVNTAHLCPLALMLATFFSRKSQARSGY